MAPGSNREEIRAATAADLPALHVLAHRSKAYWGYDEEFMRLVSPSLVPTPDELGEGVFIVERGGRVAGFYAFKTRSGSVFLESLFVAPESIRQGLGERLWRHAIEFARGAGHPSLLIESDPNAKGFYLRMGAMLVGEVISKVSGRALPLLRCQSGSC